MNKKHPYTIFIFTLAIFAIIACKKRTDYIRVGVLNGPSAISLAYIIDKPSDFGLRNTEFKIYNEPTQLRSAILRNDVDLATIPSVMACNLINKGTNIKIAAIPVWGSLHLYGNAENIVSWADLKGKEVFMMAKGLTPDILFRALLRANDLIPEKDVKINYTFQSHHDLANASIAGLADLAVLSEPLVSMVLDKNKSMKRVFDLNTEWALNFGDSIPLAQTALIVNFTNPLVTKAWLDTFMIHYSTCCEFVNDRPELTADFIVRRKIIPDKQVALDAIPGCNIRFVKAEEIAEGIINYFNFFYKIDPRLSGDAPGNIDMIYTSKTQTKPD